MGPPYVSPPSQCKAATEALLLLFHSLGGRLLHLLSLFLGPSLHFFLLPVPVTNVASLLVAPPLREIGVLPDLHMFSSSCTFLQNHGAIIPGESYTPEENVETYRNQYQHQGPSERIRICPDSNYKVLAWVKEHGQGRQWLCVSERCK